MTPKGIANIIPSNLSNKPPCPGKILPVSLIFGFFIGILAFSGDLLESAFKRKIGVKDSGKLIPGHGGLLDRFDGYFLVIPFLYISIN